MSRPHTAMRKIRDVLRLRFGEHLSLRDVAASLQIPFTTVSDHVRRAPRPDCPGHCPTASMTTASTRCCSARVSGRRRIGRCPIGRRSIASCTAPG